MRVCSREFKPRLLTSLLALVFVASAASATSVHARLRRQHARSCGPAAAAKNLSAHCHDAVVAHGGSLSPHHNNGRPSRGRLLRGPSSNATLMRLERQAINRSRGGERADASHDLLGWKALCLSEEQQQQMEQEQQEQTPGGALQQSDAARPSSSSTSSSQRRAHGGCVHKPLLYPRLVTLDVVFSLLVFLIAALALASGIGGGGIYVPALNLLLRFRPHVAVGLSQALICGGAIGALLVNARERHPLTATRPLIDYELAAFLSPAEMAGAQLGVVLNQSLPSPVILATMAALLSLLSVRTIRKGFAALAKERDMYSSSSSRHGSTGGGGGGGGEEEAAALAGAAGEEEEAAALADAGSGSGSTSSPPSSSWLRPLAIVLGGSGGPVATSATTAVSAPSCGYPLYEIALLAVVWLGLLLVLVLRGRKGAPSLLGVKPCSLGYWSVTALGIVWLLAVCVAAGRRLVRRGGERRAMRAAATHEGEAASGDLKVVEGDVQWDGARAARCLVLALVAGIVAGLVGVGGGMVLGPMMLELGVLPQVSSATTGTMVLLTSSSAAAVFLLGGLIPLDYAAALALVAACGGFAGKAGVAILVKRYRASAFIILLLGGLIAVSMLATTAAGLLDLRGKYAAGKLTVASLMPHAPCASGD